MDIPDTVPEMPHEVEATSPVITRRTSPKDVTRRILGLIKHWASQHTGEILWAFVFAVLAGYVFALYSEEPKPYKIYVVADSDTDSETLKMLQTEDQKSEFTRIGGVKVQVQLEILPHVDQNSRTAAKIAQKLVEASDTLLVIEHGRSQNIEDSVRAYFGARPQIPLITTVATDDDLLTLCRKNPSQTSTMETNQGDSCFDGYWFDALTQNNEAFAPLLQISPTNLVQGSSAVQFAVQRGNKHRFLIVLGNDPNDQSYTDNMKNAYSAAIHDAHAELVGVLRMNELPSSDFESLRPDCVLYAGGSGEAQTLFNHLLAVKRRGAEFSLMLSDSVIQSRGTDADLAEFIPVIPGRAVPPAANVAGGHGPIVLAGKLDRVPAEHPPKFSSVAQYSIPVNFTYQTDASDYNSHNNPYVDDAFSVALQLINDLNKRGSDIRLRVKSLLHVQNARDVRRNLLRVMKENSSSRIWYKSASGTPYVFDGPKQYHGIFHVWQLRQPSSLPGAEMDDVDYWHMPRAAAKLQGDKLVTVQK
jgi:hypothetical protein